MTYATAGDRGEDVDKSRSVALEQALLADEIDAPVHSAKDVPAEPAEGLEGWSRSRSARTRGDALYGAPSLEALEPGARVGLAASAAQRSSGPRAQTSRSSRCGQRRHEAPEARRGQYDALVLAAAA